MIRPTEELKNHIVSSSIQIVIMIVITVYSPSLPWLGDSKGILWPGDSKGTFRSSSQAASCPPVYHAHDGGFTLSLFIAEREAGKL